VIDQHPVIAVADASEMDEGRATDAAGAPIPTWWKSAPALVATAIERLPIAPGSLHIAMYQYAKVSTEVYLGRVAHRRSRLRPSASLELDPSRLLAAHLGDGGLTEAYFYMDRGDVRSAVTSAATAGDAAVVVRTVCDWRAFRVEAMAVPAAATESDLSSLTEALAALEDPDA